MSNGTRTDTRDLIINALFRLAQRSPDQPKFTLTEIATEAKISRQAIYQKHYDNVDDIIQDIYQQIATETRATMVNTLPEKGTSPFQMIVDDVVPVLYEHREWMKIIYNSSLHLSWAKHVESYYRPWLRQHIKKTSLDLDIDEDILLQLLMGQITNLMVAWMSQPVPLSPNIFKQKFLKLIMISPNGYVDPEFRIKYENNESSIAKSRESE